MINFNVSATRVEGEVPGAPHFQEQLSQVASALEAGLRRGDLAGFFDAFRSSDLPFLGWTHQEDAHGLFRACFNILHRLGGISPAAALAIENHLYVSSALATFPLRDDPDLDARRRALLEQIIQKRMLVANTSTTVHADKVASRGTVTRRVKGGFQVDGTAAYTSLASHGDILVLISIIEGEGPAVFFSPIRGNSGLEIGPLLLPRAMVESDTRRLTFREFFVPEENLLLSSSNKLMQHLITYELSWHQLLIPSLYLGAGAAAIEEVRRFLQSVRGRNDQPLAELDGMVIDAGRMALQYRAACCTALQAGCGLVAASRSPLSTTALSEALDLASTSKYTGTRCAEELVAEARRIVGVRAFAGGHPLERLSLDVMFGPLGPEVNAAIERRIGQRVLGTRSFLEQC
jgi:alkylation response protein AidB-like acyl-CoA dehydrogenase